MKSSVLALALVVPALAGATDLTFYASTKKAYSCTGYNVASCTGFEVSDPTHHIDYAKVRPWTTDPSKMLVSLQMDSGPTYTGVYTPGDPNPFRVDANDGTTLMLKVNYVAALNCVKACVTRYLVENGTVTLQ